MKIVSSYKDYYDFAFSGIAKPDESLVYFRNLDIKEYKMSLRAEPNDYFSPRNNTNGTMKSKFYVYFCGQVFKGIQEISYNKKENISIELFDDKYSYIDFDKGEKELILKNFKEIAGKEPIVVLKAFSKVIQTTPERNIDWRNSAAKKRADLFKEQNTKILISDKLVYKTQYVINDSLKNVSFNKILEPHLVYQELELFLGDINSKEIDVVFSDIEKRNQHGFDKYSFRH